MDSGTEMYPNVARDKTEKGTVWKREREWMTERKERGKEKSVEMEMEKES